MKLLSLLITAPFMVNGLKINGIPICKNCIHFIPDKDMFSSDDGQCSQYKTINIVNGDIQYKYAKESRLDEEKCGIKGKQFELEKDLRLKMFFHKIRGLRPYTESAIFGLFIGYTFVGCVAVLRLFL